MLKQLRAVLHLNDPASTPTWAWDMLCSFDQIGKSRLGMTQATLSMLHRMAQWLIQEMQTHLNGLGSPDSADNMAGAGGVPLLMHQNVLDQQQQPQHLCIRLQDHTHAMTRITQ